MDRCEQYEGILAASLYEEAPEDEQRALDAHLAECAACREEAEALRAVVEGIPAERPVLDRDLSLLLRQRVARTHSWWRRREVIAVVAASVLIVFALTTIGPQRVFAPTHSEVVAPPTAPTSPVMAAMVEVEQLLETRKFGEAYERLQEAIGSHPEDEYAAEAQLALADIAYSELHWYPEAHRAYDALARDYPARFRESVLSRDRREVLAEAEVTDYASLYRLDAARRYGIAGLEEYEAVLAKYPGTYVASMAAAEIAELVQAADDYADGAEGRMAALEATISKMNHPTAVAQLKVELGHMYREDGSDRSKARRLYEDVLDDGNVVLARIARDSLLELEASDAR